jgi:hypothetical protein
METTAYAFSTQEQYLFCWENGATPKMSVTHTVYVNKDSDEILFQVNDGRGKFDSAVSVLIKKTDIVAVKDDANGVVEIKGFAGKYTILNKELFKTYVAKGLIELANKTLIKNPHHNVYDEKHFAVRVYFYDKDYEDQKATYYFFLPKV